MTTPESPQYLNPFLQPGADGRHDVPLNPFVERAHEDHYIDVDHAREAFEEFCVKLSDDPSRLKRAGWFVAVTGPTGCGKTSLINRCAHRLAAQLAEASFVPRVYDLSAETKAGDSMDVRVERVCARLVTKIKPDLSNVDADALDAHGAKPGTLLPFLSDVLPTDTVIIVILPSTDLLEEVRRWCDATRTRFVVFAEWGARGIAGSSVGDFEETSETRVLQLTVGPLVPGNGRIFVEARTSGLDPELFPNLDLAAVDDMIGIRSVGFGSTSIRHMQRMLCGLYEEYRRQPGPSQGIVRTEDLAHYILKWAESL